MQLSGNRLRLVRRVKMVILMMALALCVVSVTGCSGEALRQKRAADSRDLSQLANGDASGIVERRQQEAKTVFDERQGVMITKTQADVYAFLSTAKYYAIVAAVVCFVVGLVIRVLLGSSSMTMKRMGSFLMILMPILCVVFVVVSSFVVDAVY